MRNRIYLLLCTFGAATVLSAQITFTSKTNLLTPEQHYSGVAIAVIDANGDGLDDIVRMDQGYNLNIQYQTSPDQPFIPLPIGTWPTNSPESQWGMCTGDVDNNGFADILTGGSYDGIKFVLADATGSNYAFTNQTQPGTFVQCVNFADINNDGWLDAFVCHDDGASRIFENNKDGTFTYQPMWINLTTVPASDNSGNYGSVWSDVDNDGDVDLYIAHCRQGINDPTDPRRINQLFWNNGDGTYTQDLDNTSGLRIGAQSWTADFGDIDNDGDFDCFITNHDVTSQLLENDGKGIFTDITASSGLESAVQGLPMQGVFRDFDNDGYIDILVSGSSHFLFHNNGNKTFGLVDNPFGNNDIESFAIGDLNADGFQDIYAGYAEIYTTPSNRPDVLWMNDGNDNHYFGMSLRGDQSNRNGVGAKVFLHSGLGTQVREVRSGESYGISNSMLIHFGLGQVQTIDSVVVNWPSGIRDVLNNPAIDQYLNFGEGGCLVPAIELQAQGATTFCTGQSVDIEAPAGMTYLWSTGDTTQVITVNAAGEYKVTITTPEGCSAISNTIPVVVDPVEIPTITAASDTIFCAGGSVVLTASPASAYLWSTGETTQSISATTSGAYTVSAQGLCASYPSGPINIQALSVVVPEIGQDTVVAVDSIASFVASGGIISWFADQTGGQALETSAVFSPQISETTTFWVSCAISYSQPNIHLGQVNHQGSTSSSTAYNGGLIFDCHQPITLAKVKVYTNKAGERKIDLLDSNGALVATKTVTVPIGATIVDLGFQIPEGTDFLLTTDQSVNETTLGTISPQFYRSTSGVEFPYVLDNYLTIKTSTIDDSRYYYFYDWEVEFPSWYCESDRYPVVAVLPEVSHTSEPAWAAGLELFPNPTSGLLQVKMDKFLGGELLVTVRNTAGSTVATQVVNGGAGPLQFQTDLSRMAKGVYWMEISGENGLVRRKVVVQ